MIQVPDVVAPADVGGVSVERWLLFAAALLAAVLLERGFRLAVNRYLGRLEAQDSSTLHAIAGIFLVRTRAYFLFALALSVTSSLLGWNPRERFVVLTLLGVAFLLQTGRWADGLIEFWAERERRRRLETGTGSVALVGLVGFASRVLLWSVIVLVLLDNVGIDVTTLIAGLGIGGIAVGLGLQSVFADLFASLAIMLDRPFGVGDPLVLGEYMGTVESIGLKTTRLRSLGGEEIVLSNRQLLDREIRNYGRMRERRVQFTFGVTYDTPYARLEEIPGIVRAIVEAATPTRMDRAHFIGHGDSALDFECVYYVLDARYSCYRDVHEAVCLGIHRAFAERGIEFAFPTRTLHIAPAASAGVVQA